MRKAEFFLLLWIKKIVLFSCWGLKWFLIHWKLSVGKILLPWSWCISWLLLCAEPVHHYTKSGFSSLLLQMLEQSNRRGSWCCIFTQLRNGNILFWAAPCVSQSCQELQAKCSKHRVLWQMSQTWSSVLPKKILLKWLTGWFSSPSFWILKIVHGK